MAAPRERLVSAVVSLVSSLVPVAPSRLSMSLLSTLSDHITGKSPWTGRVAIGLSCLLLGILFGYPALAHLHALGSANDWDQHLFYHWVPYRTVIDYGEVPLWNPWACGGTPLVANPQARFMSPFFLVHLLFGPVVGLHIEIVLHLAILAGGGWFLGRELGLRPIGRAAVALGFLGTSAHYLHLAMGHTWALSYAYLPWILAFVWRAVRTSTLWPAVIAAALLALVILEGGIYPAPQAGLLVGATCVALAVQRRRLFPIAVAAVTGFGAAALAAPKLLPTLQLMWQFPRSTLATESTTPRLLFDALFARDQVLSRAVPPQAHGLTWGFHEYGAYLGPAVAILAVVALVLARRRVLGFALLGALFLLLACGRIEFGDHLSLNPWGALHELPIFSSQHVPSRFLIPFVLCVAILAGFGADMLGARWGRRGQLAALALVALGAIDAFTIGPPNLWRMYDSPVGAAGPPGAFHHEWWGDTNLMMPLARANRGALHCYESVYLKIAAQMPGPGFRGEQYLTDGSEVRLTRWSPNALDFEATGGPATVLVVNQNYHSGWTMTEPHGRTFSHQGLLAAELPAGTTRIALRYRSRAMWVGGLLALIAALAGAWIRRRERKRPQPPS